MRTRRLRIVLSLTLMLTSGLTSGSPEMLVAIVAPVVAILRTWGSIWLMLVIESGQVARMTVRGLYMTMPRQSKLDLRCSNVDTLKSQIVMILQ